MADHDLHGNAPEHAPVALLLVDVINDLEFPGGEELLASALPAAERLAALRCAARERGIPVVYANDNFGRWRSDFRRVVRHCLEDGVRGQPIAELLRPAEDDYFVLKPKHSAFFATTLETLLAYLGTRTLVLAGLTGDRCVLFTAVDAFMRDYRVIVPADCTASIDPEENRQALGYLQRVLGLDVPASAELDLDALVRDADGD